MAAGNRIMNIRTGYVLEYVPRGKRTPKREMVTEIVPVSVREVAQAKPAFTEGGEPSLFVDRKSLYAEIDLHDPTVASLEAAYRGEPVAGFYPGDWAHRSELVLQGISATNFEDTQERSGIDIRTILDDQAAEGRAYAQGVADELLVSGGKVMRRAREQFGLIASTTGSSAHLSSGRHLAPAFDMDSGYRGDRSRLFRIDQVDEANAFIARQAERKGRKLAVSDFSGGHAAGWTKAGLEGECTDAWWVIVSADTLAGKPLRGDEVVLTDLDPAVSSALSDIRSMASTLKRRNAHHWNINWRWVLPAPERAASMAVEMLARLETVRQALGRDSRMAVDTLADQIDFLLDEGRNHCPTLSDHLTEDDDIALGSFVP